MLVRAANELEGSVRFFGVVPGPDDMVDEDAVRERSEQYDMPYPHVRDRDLVPEAYWDMIGPEPYRAAMRKLVALRDAHGFELLLVHKRDRKIVVEASVDGREVEVAVLGNDHPEASVVGEIRATQAFYDYDAKYRDNASELIIPADLEPELSEAIRETATLAYQALDAEGMARVDFLVDRETHQIYVNELNSLPGFTSVSMYPKLWEATGLAYPKLLDRLIELALDRHDRRSKLETHAPPPLAAR